MSRTAFGLTPNFLAIATLLDETVNLDDVTVEFIDESAISIDDERDLKISMTC